MAHGGTRERFDFGRSTRTQFELSEAGENNLLFDELQFQIERYQSASSNDHAKASALQALVEIFSDKVTSTLKNSTRGYIQELFKLLAKGSTTEVNTKFLIALVISICRDSDGSFDQSFNLPAELVRKILKLQLTEERCNSACLCQQVNGRKRNDAPKEVIYSLTEEGRFHRKRKFASTLPPIAETNAKQIVLPALNENWSPASPTPCSRKSATAPRLVRAYGSFRASRESLNHSSSMSVISSTTSQSSSFAGASDLKDNYWFEESCSYTEPSVSVPITASLAAPLEVAAISGGFHKKRKLANQAKRVPAEVESTSVAEAPTVGSTQLPITDSSTLYDKLSSVYDTFLCKSCFTASSSDSVNVRENELLQLVLVNCYLAAKVQSLASVKLDIFQSADHPSEPIAPGEAAATEEETELEHGGAGASMQSGSGGGGGAMGGAMGGAGADADEFQAIRSPQNPSSAAVSSSFYRRQAEALAQFQLAMCEESSESSSSYLRFVCDELLVAALRDLEVCCEWGEDEEQNSSTCCAHRVTLGKLWLVLGVMDSSCFRCPTNQVRRVAFLLFVFNYLL